jgi:hypothetical protein
MNNEQYVFDMIVPELTNLFNAVWGEPKFGLNARQKIATLFAVRATRRIFAIHGLFKSGFYLESHPLVRAGYEDWVYLAFMLRQPGDSRCRSFYEGISKIDARVYDAFKILCGEVITNRYFGEPPNDVAAFIGLPRSKTKAPPFSMMADDVGLRWVHDFVYSYLSGLSHPDGRFHSVFDVSESIKARVPKRDPAKEIRLALWLTWFTSRIFVLAHREFGIDQEGFVEEYLLPMATTKGVTIETCIFLREYQNL